MAKSRDCYLQNKINKLVVTLFIKILDNIRRRINFIRGNRADEVSESMAGTDSDGRTSEEDCGVAEGIGGENIISRSRSQSSSTVVPKGYFKHVWNDFFPGLPYSSCEKDSFNLPLVVLKEISIRSNGNEDDKLYRTICNLTVCGVNKLVTNRETVYLDMMLRSPKDYNIRDTDMFVNIWALGSPSVLSQTDATDRYLPPLKKMYPLRNT